MKSLFSKLDAVRRTQEALALLRKEVRTANRAVDELLRRIAAISTRYDEPILLTGPTGTGKTRLAGRIAEIKNVPQCVVVNCATLRGDLARSELFGHERGAFTDAKSTRRGALLEASGGMLFLDEIGTLGLAEQAMLLKALEEKKFTPLGSDKTVETGDFQLVCGTNEDLAQAIAQGRFRRDLYYRINFWEFKIPGLAERPEDLEENIPAIFAEFAKKYDMPQVRFAPEEKKTFLEFAKKYPWPGNFRELAAVLRRLAALSVDGLVAKSALDEEIARLRGTEPVPDFPLPDGLSLCERTCLLEALRVCRNSSSIAEAGRAFFASPGETLSNASDRMRKYLLRYGLRWEDARR